MNSDRIKDAVDATILGAKVLVEQGWCQDAFMEARDGVLCFCLAGAITGAAPTREVAWAARDVVRGRLRTLGYKTIVAYNDAPGRTQADVVALLGAVASARAEGRGR